MVRLILILVLLPSPLLALQAGGILEERRISRYLGMLEARPRDGVVLDRLMGELSGREREFIDAYRARLGEGGFEQWMVYGYVLGRAGERAEAVEAFRKAVALSPDSSLPYAAMARALSAGGEAGEAAALYLQAAERAVDDASRADLLQLAGEAYWDAGEESAAVEVLERVLALRPGDYGRHAELAGMYARLGDYDRAVGQARKAAETDDPEERVGYLNLLGDLLEASGRLDEAGGIYGGLLEVLRPGHWIRDEVLGKLMAAYRRAGRGDELVGEWRRRVAGMPRDLGRKLVLAEMLRMTGESGGEGDVLEEALALAPNNREVRRRYLEYCEREGKLSDALEQIDWLLGNAGFDAELALRMASLVLRRDGVDAARDYLEGVRGQRPGDRELEDRILAHYREQGMPDAAENMLRERYRESGANPDLVALHAFLVEEGRGTKASGVLEEFVGEDDAGGVAGRRVEAARLELAAGRSDEALRHFRLAEAAGAEVSTYREDFATALTRDGRYGEAADVWETLHREADDPSDWERIDRNFFLALERLSEGGGGVRDSGAAALMDQFISLAGGGESESPRYRRIGEALRRSAEASPTVGRWLRAARWLRWSGSAEQAREAAESARALDPGHPGPLAMLVDLAMESGNLQRAAKSLRALSEVDVENRLEHRLRLAGLHVEMGRVEDALAGLEAIVEESPDSVEALVQLADVQLVMERSEAAEETLRRAHALSRPPMRAQVVDKLADAMQRRGKFREAARFLLEEYLASHEDARGGAGALSRLLDFCDRYALLEWLEGEVGRRLDAERRDFALQQAMAAVLAARGDAEGSREFAEASRYAVGGQAAILERLVDQAMESGDMERAAEFQGQRLLQLPGGGEFADMRRMIEIQMAGFEPAAALESARTMEKRYGRTPEAMEFLSLLHRRIGEIGRADELDAMLAAISSADPETAYRRALRLLVVGETDGAVAQLAAILETVPVGGELVFPQPGFGGGRALRRAYGNVLGEVGGVPDIHSLRSFSGSLDGGSGGGGAQRVRLQAVRRLAECAAAGNAAAGEWLEKFAGDPGSAESERLWAAFHGGMTGELEALVDGILRRRPDDLRARLMSYALLVAGGAFESAGRRLVASGDRSDGVLVLGALEEMLADASWSPREEDLRLLFPEEQSNRSILWQAAELCWRYGYPGLAVDLGMRVHRISALSRPEVVHQLVRWLVDSGRSAEAVGLLAGEVEPGGGVDEISGYQADNLRIYVELLPQQDRDALLSGSAMDGVGVGMGGDILADGGAVPGGGAVGGDAPARLAASALLYRAAGRHGEARRMAGRLARWHAGGAGGLESTPAEDRGGRFVLNAGMQLAHWGWFDMAEALWRSYAAARPADSGAHGGGSILDREVALRLALVDGILNRRALGGDALIERMTGSRDLAEQLSSSLRSLERQGMAAHAAEIGERLHAAHPESRSILNGYILSAHHAGALHHLEHVLEWLGDPTRIEDGPALLELALAAHEDVARNHGLLPRTLDAVERLAEASPDMANRLLPRLALLGRETGNVEAALDRLESAEGTAPFAVRVEHAGMLMEAGRHHEARSIAGRLAGDPALEGYPDPGRLAVLLARAGIGDVAERIIRRLARTRGVNPVVQVADRLAEAGMGEDAVRILKSVLWETAEAGDRIVLQMAVYRIGRATGREGGDACEWMRLKAMAAASPEWLRDAYSLHVSLMDPDAPVDPGLLRELERDTLRTRDVGLEVMLLKLLVATSPEHPLVAGLLDEFRERRLPEEYYSDLTTFFLNAGRPGIAEGLARDAAQRYPRSPGHALALAGVLERIGRWGEASSVLAELRLSGLHSPGVLREIAQFLEGIGRTEDAGAMYLTALDRSPPSDRRALLRDLVRLHLAAGDPTGAGRFLAELATAPATGDLLLVAEFLKMSGDPPTLPLSDRARAFLESL